MFVGGVLDPFEHARWQTQRNAVRAWLEIGQRDALYLRQIKVIGRIVRFPERAFFRLRIEDRQRFKCFSWHAVYFAKTRANKGCGLKANGLTTVIPCQTNPSFKSSVSSTRHCWRTATDTIKASQNCI